MTTAHYIYLFTIGAFFGIVGYAFEKILNWKNCGGLWFAIITQLINSAFVGYLIKQGV